MRRWMILPVLVIALLSSVAIAFAQDTGTTPAAGTVPTLPDVSDNAEATDASMTAAEATQAYVTLDLAAGFPLDPFFVSVNGGGKVDASTLSPECTGMVSSNPVLTLNWSGETDFARIFVYSDHNPSLVVQLPDGSYVCSGDTNAMLFDPQVQLNAPAAGTYNVWVGNQDKIGLIPSVLVLTTKQDVSVGGFQLSGLVRRPQMREQLAKAVDTLNLADASAVQSAIETALANAASAQPLTADAALTATTTVTGVLPGFVWPVSPLSPAPVCNGLSNATPALVFSVAEGTEAVRVFAEAASDATLLVILPDGTFACADDSEEGANRNPVVDLTNPVAGNYGVAVGRLSAEAPLDAQVTVTTDTTSAPVLLEPMAPAGASN